MVEVIRVDKMLFPKIADRVETKKTRLSRNGNGAIVYFFRTQTPPMCTGIQFPTWYSRIRRTDFSEKSIIRFKSFDRSPVLAVNLNATKAQNVDGHGPMALRLLRVKIFTSRRIFRGTLECGIPPDWVGVP